MDPGVRRDDGLILRPEPPPQCGNSDAAQALLWVAGIMFAAIWRENPGAGCSGAVSHWFNPMDVQPKRRGLDGVHDAPALAPVQQDNNRIIETSIPARLDNLRWSGFHTRVVLALGITWVLDGLEVTLAGSLAGALKESPALHFSNFDVGFANSAYLAGAVLGALGFGWLTDRIAARNCSSSRWLYI